MNGVSRYKLGEILVVTLIMLIVLSSGCVFPGGGGETVKFGPGVRIITWEPDLKGQPYLSGDRVKLLLKVQNMGEYDAKDVRAELYGISLTEWGAVWSEEDLGDLKAANEQYNTPGETRTKQWILEAPVLPKGTEVLYEPKVRVSYDYTTVATKPVTIVDADELRRLIHQGKTIPGEPTRYTSGPLSVEIITGDFIKTEGRDPYLPIHIIIRNIGEGTISNEGYYGWGDVEMDYPIEVTVKVPHTMHIVGGEECTGGSEVIEMWQGREAEVTCEVTVEPVEISQKEIIEVDVKYRYQVDATTQVKVIGEELGFF